MSKGKFAAFVVAAVGLVACAAGEEGTLPLPGDGGVGDDASISDTSTGTDAPVFVVDVGNEGGGCTPKTCTDLGQTCGQALDGCGGTVECGVCANDETCVGIPAICEKRPCTKTTCAAIGAGCGVQGDGCGATIDCGTCPTGEQCGLGGTNKCGAIVVSDAGCTATTCTAQGANCGPISDGCGGALQCGTCNGAIGESCGGGGVANKCGKPPCTPKDCAALNANCGTQANGCGATIDCGLCSGAGETCGGGGPNRCGVVDAACTAKTCADISPFPANCGTHGNGCGGTIVCGTCDITLGESCGGGGTSNLCGKPACTKTTCAAQAKTCGPISDGCNGLLTCGRCSDGSACDVGDPKACKGTGACIADCPVGQACGAIVPNVCGSTCVKKSCTDLNANCGIQSDGCGTTIDCGTCDTANGFSCGGGGIASQCGKPACTPTTCALSGKNCGALADGCGKIIQCGTCGTGQVCGLTAPNVCGSDPACTGLCTNVAACTPTTQTKITGTVYAPNGIEPLYNALVYIPTGAIAAIPDGLQCDRCGTTSDTAFRTARTGPDGKFTLTNVPSGINYNVVIQLGKWRKVIPITGMTACTTRALSSAETSLPKNKSQGSIPKMAVSTGSVDSLECVLRKIGVDAAEFTNSSGTGRIHLYRSNGVFINDGTSLGLTANDLTSDVNRLKTYDLVLFGCEAREFASQKSNQEKGNLKSYADAGGRLFMTHLNYGWLYNYSPFSTTAPWNVAQPRPTAVGPTGNQKALTGVIDTAFPKGLAFSQWIGATTVSIGDSRHDIDNVVTADYGASAPWPASYASQRWIYSNSQTSTGGNPAVPKGTVQHYTFNTPVGLTADKQCGRVAFSDFHVDGFFAAYNGATACTADANCRSGDKCMVIDFDTGQKACVQSFTNGCAYGPLSAQEKILEFMIFDASSCISDETKPIPTCTATTCALQGKNCGQIGDGCGAILTCGTCLAPESCGGGGTANVCGSSCDRLSCGEQSANCGTVADGCGGTQSCGTCVAPASCGAGGQSSICGTPTCTVKDCAALGANCGTVGNGCGGTIDCGTCSGTQTCGGGGVPNTCGSGTCTAKSCTQLGATCGIQGNGCGGTVDCGNCVAPATCGGGGVPNQCGAPTCVTRTCAQAGATCGPIGDGCGGVLNCGPCVPPQTCGGGGVPSRCGGSCTQKTCAIIGATCGLQGDGCGGSLSCGVCPPGQACVGIPSRCVALDAGTCTPKDCTQLGQACGLHGDGCGGLVDCGKCANTCTPKTCNELAAASGLAACNSSNPAPSRCYCGPVADGCGGLLDCGVCKSGETCGGSGTPSVCGGVF